MSEFFDTSPAKGRDPQARRPPAFALIVGIAAGLIPLVGLLPSVSASQTHTSAVVAAICGLVIFGVAQVTVAWSYHSARLTDRLRLALLLPLIALSVGLPLVFGPDWAILLPYLAAAAAVAVPPKAAFAGLVLPVVLSALVVDWVPGSNSTAIIIMTAAVGVSMTSYRRILDLVAELRRTRQELARAAVAEERLRFSRDMHDLLGHSLLHIVLKAEVVRRLHKSGKADVEAEVREIETLGREALAQVREAVTGYRKLALSSAIADARSSLADAGIDVIVHAPEVALPADAEDVFSWVLREGVTNVVRHSSASSCEIEVRVDETQAVLEVLDNGGGVPSRTKSEFGGNGLAGLAERVAELNGRLVAGKRTGGGFRLTAALPLGGPTG